MNISIKLLQYNRLRKVSNFYFYGLLTLLVNTKKSANNRVYSTQPFYTGLLEVRHSLSFLLLTLGDSSRHGIE